MTVLRFTAVDQEGNRSIPIDITITVGPQGKFVSPNATNGNGSLNNPWSLAQAIAGAKPGDTIWLRGGQYNNSAGWVFKCLGTQAQPIVFRSYPLEWAILTCDVAQKHVVSGDVAGRFIDFKDVGVKGLSSIRAWNDPGTNQRGSGFDMRSLGTNLINNIITDTGVGIGHWVQTSAGVATECTGNIVLNCGSQGSDRAHGPGAYLQHQGPSIKTIKHNLFLNNFENGYKFGTDAGYVESLRMIENVVLNPGAHYETHIATGNYDATEIYASQHPINNVVVDGDIYWISNDSSLISGGSGIDNYYAGSPADFTMQNLWIRAFNVAVFLQRPITGPVVLKDSSLWIDRAAWGGARILADKSGSPQRTYRNNKYWANTYFMNGKWLINTTDYTDFNTFKAATGETGTFGLKPPDQVWVHPNSHEIGRANITVFNGNAKASNVVVNCNSVLNPGDSWWLYNAINPYAGAIASGTYQGSITVPMTTAVAGEAALATGTTAVTPSSLPDFGSFVLRRVGPQWVAPPTNLTI